MKIIPESGEYPNEFLSIDDITVYNTDIEYLLDELHRIDIIIRSYLKKCRLDHQGYMDDFQGLYISEEEVNTILQTPACELKSDYCLDSELEHIETITREIYKKKINSINKGKELRLHLLSELFNLQPFEVDVLLICLAPELDLRYEKLYSYIQNDVTKKWPQVNLIINLLISSIEERLRGREYFSPDAPLIKNRIIHLTGNVPEDHSSLISKFIKVDDRIINYLMCVDEIDPKIRNFSSVLEPKSSISNLIMAEEKKNALAELIKRQTCMRDHVIFHFHGAYGTGKKTAAEIICKELGTLLLVVDSKCLAGEESVDILIIILREALLQKSSLFLEGFDVLLKNEESGIPFNILMNKLDRFPGCIFLSGRHSWEPKRIFKNHRLVNYAFQVPDFALRKQLWESFLNHNYNLSEDVDIATIASEFKLSGGQIQDAIFTACNIAMAKNADAFTLSMPDLYKGCKAQSNKNLTTIANKIEPHHTWEDLVLPADNAEQLKEVSGYIKHKGTVYTDWGFDKKLSMGKGLNILFSGPSGTGKTMAAGIIASEVGLDLYKIDLSGIVSKYIGETEKNLKKIFKEAESSNVILFFDEADALFGKRSEVKDSHDRYANIEINYLLQKMEEHEGIVILATNFKKNMDEAFLRRLHFTIEFPLPDEMYREKIWRNIFPEETPIEKSLDFKFLSSFKISGGNIKNIALSAAFLAIDDSHIIKMEYIIRAMKREFQKMGKICTQVEFGKYYQLVK